MDHLNSFPAIAGQYISTTLQRVAAVQTLSFFSGLLKSNAESQSNVIKYCWNVYNKAEQVGPAARL